MSLEEEGGAGMVSELGARKRAEERVVIGFAATFTSVGGRRITRVTDRFYHLCQKEQAKLR